MGFIYLHKLELPETVRVNPDEIRMVQPIETVKGSLVTFKNDDFMRYKESPGQIQLKEWLMRFGWPNLERLLMAVLGGIIGVLLTSLVRAKIH
jgi:hypothetical protein